MSAQPKAAPPLDTLVRSPAVDTSVATPSRQSGASRSSRQARRWPTLVLIATGGDVKVSARAPGGRVLFRGVLRQDQQRRFDDPRINLVVADSSALQVIINGQKQRRGEPGESRSYRITKSASER
jgi:hypothetical protein